MSNLRSPKKLLIPGCKQPHLLKRNDRRRGQGMAAYIRKGFSASRKPNYECDCHEVLVLKVCGKYSNFYLFSIYRNPDADDEIFDCLLSSMALYRKMIEKLHSCLLVILMLIIQSG